MGSPIAGDCFSSRTAIFDNRTVSKNVSKSVGKVLVQVVVVLSLTQS